LVFDFSSRVNLRRTTIAFPPTQAAFWRLSMGAASEDPAGTGSVHLQYKDLKLDVTNLQTGAFKVESVRGRTGQERKYEAQYDHYQVPAAEMRLETDAEARTVVHLGRVNLPLERLRLTIDSPYYYRRVEVWTAEEDQPGLWQCRYGGFVYHIPGMPAPETLLVPGLGRQRWVKLVIDNGDNPPLALTGVELGWLRRELFFLPAAGRSYALYAGNPRVTAPSYDTAHLIPYRAATADQLPALSVAEPVANPTYDAKAVLNPAEARARQQRYLFTGLAVLIALLLAGWLVKLVCAGQPQAKEPPPPGEGGVA